MKTDSVKGVRRTLVTLAAVLATTAVSGCTTLDQPRPAVLASTPGAVRGGTLTIGITDPGSLSPLDATTPSAKLISRAMCDTLVMLDPETNQTREGILDSWVNAEGGTFVTLRPLHGVRFNDGTVLKATDLNVTLRQLGAKVNGSPAAPLARNFAAGVLGPGGKPRSDPAGLLADGGNAGPDPATPLNDYDVQVQAADANGRVVRSFAEPAMAPISAAAFAADPNGFRGKPVCVGPYRVEQAYHPGDASITLVRSAGYYAKNLGYTSGGTGYADRLVFKIYPTTKASYAAYQKGEVDVTEVPDNTVLPATTPGVVPGAFPMTEYVGFSVTQGAPFDNVALRRALSLALDRRRLAAVLGVSGEAATGFVPPSLTIERGRTGREIQDGMTFPECANAPAAGDVAAARKALDASGIDKRRTIELITNEEASAPLQKLYEAMVEQWSQKLGLTISLNPTLPWSYFTSVGPAGTGLGFFRYGWASDAVSPTAVYNDPISYLEGMLGGNGVENFNWTLWSSAQLSTLLADRTGVSSAADQLLKVTPTLGALCRDLPLIPVVDRRHVWLVRPEKVGTARAHYTAPDGQPLLRELYVPARS